MNLKISQIRKHEDIHTVKLSHRVSLCMNRQVEISSRRSNRAESR